MGGQAGGLKRAASPPWEPLIDPPPYQHHRHQPDLGCPGLKIRTWIQNALTLKVLQVSGLQALGAQQGILSG